MRICSSLYFVFAFLLMTAFGAAYPLNNAYSTTNLTLFPRSARTTSFFTRINPFRSGKKDYRAKHPEFWRKIDAERRAKANGYAEEFRRQGRDPKAEYERAFKSNIEFGKGLDAAQRSGGSRKRREYYSQHQDDILANNDVVAKLGELYRSTRLTK